MAVIQAGTEKKNKHIVIVRDRARPDAPRLALDQENVAAPSHAAISTNGTACSDGRLGRSTVFGAGNFETTCTGCNTDTGPVVPKVSQPALTLFGICRTEYVPDDQKCTGRYLPNSINP